jgi:hypothetical protein
MARGRLFGVRLQPTGIGKISVRKPENPSRFSRADVLRAFTACAVPQDTARACGEFVDIREWEPVSGLED